MNCWKIQNLTFFGFTANWLEFLGACLSLHCCRCKFFTGIFSAFLAVEMEGFLVKVKGESFFGGKGLANSKSKFRLSSKSLSIQFWNEIKTGLINFQDYKCYILLLWTASFRLKKWRNQPKITQIESNSKFHQKFGKYPRKKLFVFVFEKLSQWQFEEGIK